MRSLLNITYFRESHYANSKQSWKISVRGSRPEVFCRKGVLKYSDLMPAILLKKRLWHRCFPVNFAKILKAHFLKNISGGCFCPVIPWKMVSRYTIHWNTKWSIKYFIGKNFCGNKKTWGCDFYFSSTYFTRVGTTLPRHGNFLKYLEIAKGRQPMTFWLLVYIYFEFSCQLWQSFISFWGNYEDFVGAPQNCAKIKKFWIFWIFMLLLFKLYMS